MNIFFRELKASRKSLIIWSVIAVLFCWMGFQKASAYFENPEMLAIIDTLPPGLMAAFGVEAFNLTTVTGFFGVMVIYFALILGIAATMWGSGVISKEERDKTVEFSLTLPVRRSRLITAKALAMLVNCIVLLIVTGGAMLGSVAKYNPDQEFYKFAGLCLLSFLILELIFLALGIFLGCALKKHKLAGALGVWILIGMYFLSILIGLDENLDFLKYFTPFKYFDAGNLLHDGMNIGFVLLSAAIIVVLVAGSYATYAKRDLYI